MHTGSNPGLPHFKSSTLSPWLPLLTIKLVNFYCTHNKWKNFKICISETKAHWTKGQERFSLFSVNFPLIPFSLNPSVKSDDLSLLVSGHCKCFIVSKKKNGQHSVVYQLSHGVDDSVQTLPTTNPNCYPRTGGCATSLSIFVD